MSEWKVYDYSMSGILVAARSREEADEWVKDEGTAYMDPYTEDDEYMIEEWLPEKMTYLPPSYLPLIERIPYIPFNWLFCKANYILYAVDAPMFICKLAALYERFVENRLILDDEGIMAQRTVKRSVELIMKTHKYKGAFLFGEYNC